MFGRIQTVDNKVLYNISRMHKPALTKIMVASSRLGNAGFVWWAICIPFFVVPEWRKTGFNFVFALCLAHLMGEIIIKHLVKRTRPCHLLEDEEQIINKPRFYSFPSGHTASSFAAVVPAIVNKNTRKIGIAALIVAILMAVSRIYVCVHYPSDVVGGLIVGLLCGIASCKIFEKLMQIKDK